MLSYQDTGYHDDATLRELLGKTPTPPFQEWLERLGLWRDGRLTAKAGDASFFLHEPADALV
jgi:ethanolamine ammonia-lyase large subunit